jgi:UDPglucose 6-dehydrogenase
MRDASSIKVIETLLGKGVAAIHAYDPLANDTARKEFDPSKNILFEKIRYFDSAKEAILGSHALFISSDCEEFRGFSRTIEDTVKPPYLVMDGRRMIPDYDELVAKNYTFLAVGSMVLTPQKVEAVEKNVKLKSVAV